MLLGEVIVLVEKHPSRIAVEIDNDRTLEEPGDACRIDRGLTRRGARYRQQEDSSGTTPE